MFRFIFIWVRYPNALRAAPTDPAGAVFELMLLRRCQSLLRFEITEQSKPLFSWWYSSSGFHRRFIYLNFLPNSRKNDTYHVKLWPEMKPFRMHYAVCSIQLAGDTTPNSTNKTPHPPDPPRQRRANAGPQVASRGWPILGHSTRSPTSAQHKARRAEACGASVTSVQLSWVAVKAGIAAPRSARASTAAGAAGLGSVGSLAGKLNRFDLTSVAGPEPWAAADRGASLWWPAGRRWDQTGGSHLIRRQSTPETTRTASRHHPRDTGSPVLETVRATSSLVSPRQIKSGQSRLV